ncbi:NADH-quinone oxidoreductase subunit L [Dysgonomonas sp. 25]|uniref:NADH-quinone oxidoreductase subunit L n=1 Tax=Dysgonomonas sp. 25 TaxID=2302933 RepID=UPI0013D8CC7E|nr:NADH-quinone oxidoreductase subunit L [Dysgonomonas sp. 25]NDV69877.1 NADH-quinone oxidoreductase subunit L [Dysgonomonas sp. 25]
MEKILIIILLLSPLAGFFFNMCLGNKIGGKSGIVATLAVLVSFVISAYFFGSTYSSGEPVHVHLFEWFSVSNFTINFDFTLDQLSLLWMLVVTGVGSLIHLYSIGYMKGDENIGKFFAYLNLFIFFMTVLVISSNLLVLFIGWEGVGLCSYLLIGFWYKNQSYNDAAKKAFIMNRVGDLAFLVGIFTLIYLFGTVDYEGLKLAVSSTANLEATGLLTVATLCLFIGATGKSAQIPLYTWLPDAMAGPTPVSALIHAATMVTAGIFMITRLNFLFDLTPDILWVIAIVGAATALFAATIGLVQTDIKKVLAYSTVSQLGLMFLAIGCGAYHIAVFHVITHAFFKACLFLGAGSVIHGMGGEQDMRRMGGLRGKMLVTFATFAVSAVAIAGIPPLSGFFSKDEIMIAAFEKNTILWIVGVVASLLTAIYIFRAVYLTFYKNFRGTKEQEAHVHESPASMTIPLIILAVFAAFGGLISLPFGLSWLNNYLEPVLPKLAYAESHLNMSTHLILMIVSSLIAIVGWAIAFVIYNKKNAVPAEDSKKTGFVKLLYNKYYIDELYDKVIVKPIYALGKFFNNIIEKVLSGCVAAFAKITDTVSYPLRGLQNGRLGFYLLCFVVGFCCVACYMFLV